MQAQSSLVARNPFAGSSRLILVAAFWLAFTLGQATLLAAAASWPSGAWTLFALYGSIGLAWTALTIPVGMLTHALSRRSSGTLRMIGAHVIGLVICSFVDAMVRREMTRLLGGELIIPWYGTMLYFADRTFVGYLVIVLLARALEAHDRFVARERLTLALQAQLARARLASLEEQLHPHFLFNCLGAVTELAHEAPAAASRMLTQLASVLRFGLQRGGSEVTVGEEFAALEPYLEVQRARFADWLTIECLVHRDARDLMLPPLILQPLVENAIRHGLARRDAAGQIRISASIREAALVLEVRDNGVGLSASSTAPSRGIGTTNVRHRLAALYGTDAQLMLFEEESGGAVSQVTIPIRRREDVITADAAALGNEGIGDESLVPPALRSRPVLIVVLAWSVWGVLWTQQSIAYLAFRNRLGGRSFSEIALHDFAIAMLWAAVTPLMLLMLRVIPLRSRGIGFRLAAHGAAAFLIAAFHGWLGRVLLADEFAALSAEGIAAIAWGMLAYAVVLTVAYHGQIRAWLRDRELTDSRMRVSIAEAELQATTSRARPQQLLERLETIARSIHTDAANAERALARLGDQLRETLDARISA